MPHPSKQTDHHHPDAPQSVSGTLPAIALVALLGLAACGEATDTPADTDTTVPPLEDPAAAPGTDDNATTP